MNPPVNLWTSPRESSVCVPVWDHWSGVAAASFPGWWDLILKMWSSTECGQLLLEVRKAYRVSVEFPFWCFLTCYCFLTIPNFSAFLLAFWTFSKGFYLKGRVTGDLRGWLIFLPSLFTVPSGWGWASVKPGLWSPIQFSQALGPRSAVSLATAAGN